jgi:hypothetical protein
MLGQRLDFTSVLRLYLYNQLRQAMWLLASKRLLLMGKNRWCVNVECVKRHKLLKDIDLMIAFSGLDLNNDERFCHSRRFGDASRATAASTRLIRFPVSTSSCAWPLGN